jgi:hypothetical protein
MKRRFGRRARPRRLKNRADHARLFAPLIPAKAGIQSRDALDPRLRGDERELGTIPQPILNPVMVPSWKLNLNRADIVSRHKANSSEHDAEKSSSPDLIQGSKRFSDNIML